MQIDYKKELKDRNDFVLKFSDAPFDPSGKLNGGWAEPTYDKFFTRMVDQPVLLNQSTMLPMTALQHDLDMLGVDLELQSQRNLTTQESLVLADIDETSPDKVRKVLTAHPLVAKTIITDNFIEENIEKAGFLDTYVGLLADQMGGAFEKAMIFCDTASTETIPSGYKVTDGILKQLVNAHGSGAAATEQGLAKLVFKDDIANGVIESIERYIDNDGNLNKATCVLPPQIYGRLVSEIATDRETNWGDMVYQDGKVLKILGVEIKQDNILRKSKNGYSSMKFNNEWEYSASGTSIDKMIYGFIGQPNNLVFGMMRDMEVKNQWDIDVLGYKVALTCKGDAKVLYDQDTLAIPFSLNNTPTSSNKK